MTRLKTEYSKKLTSLKVKSKFMSNLKASITERETLDSVIEEINEAVSFETFIAGAFDFEKAIEGKAFWINISKS